MLGFGSLRCACIILGGIESMQMIAKGQMKHAGKVKPSAVSQFYSLVK
jgi:putative transposase